MNNVAHKKKILLVTTSDRMAGAEKNIVDLLTHINRTKYEPRLVVLKSDPNGQLVWLARELGVPADIIGIESKWQFYRLYRLWNIIRSFRPDILESFLFFDNQVCRIIGTLLHVPHIISGQQNVETRRLWWRNCVDRLTIRYADRVISNTDAGGQWYVDHGYLRSEKICVAKNGVDIEKLHAMQAQYQKKDHDRNIFGHTIQAGTHALVSVGFLTEQKGMTYLLDALRILKNRGVAVVSFIIGDGVLRNSLEDKAYTIGVHDIVHLAGYQRASYQYLQLFDAFVMPSLWEGLPNVIIEAMASNVPVISTAVGGIPEVVIHNTTGLLIEPGNAEMIANAIQQEINMSADERAMMIDRAFHHIQTKFSVQAMVASYEVCYEELLQ